MKDRAFFNWLIILLGVVAIIGFCFTPLLAENIDSEITKQIYQSEDDFMLEEPGADLEISDENFGTGYQYTWIPMSSFAPWASNTGYLPNGNYRYFTSTTNAYMVSGINLPSGAYLYLARFYYYDNHAGAARCRIYRHTYPHFNDLLQSYESSGTPGLASGILSLNHTIQNGDGNYSVYVGATEASGNLQVSGVRLYWKRQISPAPSAATFNDVGTGHWAFQKIEALAASGITAGCGGGNFCPDQAVTRAQMAVFLAKALGLHWSYPY